MRGTKRTGCRQGVLRQRAAITPTLRLGLRLIFGAPPSSVTSTALDQVFLLEVRGLEEQPRLPWPQQLPKSNAGDSNDRLSSQMYRPYKSFVDEPCGSCTLSSGR